MEYTTVKTISETDRYKLVGLLTLSQQLEKQFRAIERAAMEITGEEISGHTSDAVWVGQNYEGDPVAAVGTLLKNLGIDVGVLPEIGP